jgi:small conductance mechanosensitive channel
MATEPAPLQESLAALEHVQRKAIDLGLAFGPKLFTALLILVAGYYAGRWVGRGLDNMLARLHLDITARQLLVRIARVLVLGLFMIMALQNLGVDLLPLIAGLGVAGAGIALAMQGVLSNLAAGLTIVFTRPYRVGEYISIAGEEGRVENITLFNTILSHADLSKIVIPNRKIAGEILHNHGDIRQLRVDVGVAYHSNMDAALAAVHELLRANPRVLQHPVPYVHVSTLADSSVNITVRPWVKVPDYADAIGELNRALLETFRARGIEIPFQQREVHLVERSAR